MTSGAKPFFETHKVLLEDYVKLSSTIGARVDYVQGGGGNTSVKLDEQLMAIKASGYKLSDIEVDKAYAVMDLKALQDFYLRHQSSDFEDVEKEGSALAKAATLSIDGLKGLRPSVEAGFHAILDRFVAHSHSVYANLACCTTTSAEVLTTTLDKAAYAWGIVEYTDPGAKLAFAIKNERERVKELRGFYPQVIFMQNHGLIITSDAVDDCLSIHEDVNKRLAAYFGYSPTAFPEINTVQADDGSILSATPYLQERLRSGAYDSHFFEETLLYPDQQVFLTDVLHFSDEPMDGKANIREDGQIIYRLPQPKAQVIEETLSAVIFIVETITAKGLQLSLMGDEARDFIGNWESEKYRQQISEGKV